MIKKLFLLFLIVFALSFAFACNDKKDDDKQNEIVQEYTVTFVTNGEKTEVKVKDGEKASKPNDPVKEGYTFVGWFVGETEYAFDAVTSNVTVTAKFEEVIVEYTVKFVADGEETLVAVKEGEKASKPNDPVKEGYTFVGWFVGETEYAFDAVTSDLEVVAKFEEVIAEYTVKFVADGEETLVAVKEGEKAVKPTDPKKDGYIFLGWYLGDEAYDFEKAVTSDLELIAKFEEVIAEYTVKFVVDGEETSIVVKEGEKVAKPADPDIVGYNFLGWYVGDAAYDFEALVISDLEVVAKLEIIKYSITFVVDDDMTEVEVAYGESAAKPADPVKEGFEFIGWFIDDVEYDFGVVTEDIKLYASFKEIIIYHTVTFIDEDNNEIGVITVKHGDSILEEDYPKVEGFTLVNMSHDLKNIDKDLTVKCEFKQLYNVVIYDTKGSVYKNMQVPRGETLEEIDLSLENDSKFNYSVSDWYTDKELTKRFRLSRPVSYDLELYPRVYATPVNSNYEGLTVSILGDSISTFYSTTSDVNSYYTGDNQFYYPRYSATVKKVTGTWWYQAIEASKTKLGINNSWSGTNLYGTSSSCGMSAERIKTLGDNGTPDIIIIFLGTNDNVNGISASTFKAGYHQAFKQIEMHYPNAYVMCCTLGYSAYTGYNYTEKDRLEYNDVTRDICKQYKAKVIEVAEVQTIDSYTSLLGDNLHPNADGMIKISEKVVKAIDDMFTIGVPIN